jgi:hypothetical protein
MLLTTANDQISGYVEVWNRYLGRNVRVEQPLAQLAAALLRWCPLQHCYATPDKGVVSLVFDEEVSAGAFTAAYIGQLKALPLSGESHETITGKVVEPGQSIGRTRGFHFVDFPASNLDAVIRMMDGCRSAA